MIQKLIAQTSKFNGIILITFISVTVFAFKSFPSTMTVPQAGSFYPIYNNGTSQYIPPTLTMPFNKISTLYVAFAHVYPDTKSGAIKLEFEKGHPGQLQESKRLALLVRTAKIVNPNIKIIISLGWGKSPSDWSYISEDYTSGKNNFPKSIVNFIRTNHLDGFDIDDESVFDISQANFDTVAGNIKKALNKASWKDNKDYYFTITPAFGKANVDTSNMHNFDMVNAQNYGGTTEQVFVKLGVPKEKITVGVNSEASCSSQNFPDHKGLAGIFNWSMSADSNCEPSFNITNAIANDVGYPKKQETGNK